MNSVTFLNEIDITIFVTQEKYWVCPAIYTIFICNFPQEVEVFIIGAPFCGRWKVVKLSAIEWLLPMVDEHDRAVYVLKVFGIGGNVSQGMVGGFMVGSYIAHNCKTILVEYIFYCIVIDIAVFAFSVDFSYNFYFYVISS